MRRPLLPLLLTLPLLTGCESIITALTGPEPVPASEQDTFTPEGLAIITEARNALQDEPEALANLEAHIMEARVDAAPPPAGPTGLEVIVGIFGGGGALAGLYGARPRSRKHLMRAMGSLFRCRLPSAAKALGSMVGLGSGSVHDALHSATLAAERAGDLTAANAISDLSLHLKAEPDVQQKV